MLGFKKDARYLAQRKSDALGMFYVAKEKLSKVLADQASYGFEIQEKIDDLKREQEFLNKEYKSTSKILEKIDEFLG